MITTSWADVHHLQAHQKATVACIHGNPWLGDILAGQSRTVRGCVVLTAGGLDDAWKNTKGILKSLKPKAR